MERQLFNMVGPISKLYFLRTFKHAFNNLAIQEWAAMFSLPYLMTDNSKQDLTPRIKDMSVSATKMTRPPKIASMAYFVATTRLSITCYKITDNGTIDSIDAAIPTLAQRDNPSPVAFKEVILRHISSCCKFYD